MNTDIMKTTALSAQSPKSGDILLREALMVVEAFEKGDRSSVQQVGVGFWMNAACRKIWCAFQAHKDSLFAHARAEPDCAIGSLNKFTVVVARQVEIFWLVNGRNPDEAAKGLMP